MPWSTQFTGFSGQVFVLSAQGQGTMTCRILINGNVVKDATATGTPARTACSL
ncbi:MmpS family transport accessory protein [Mycobacterium lacus]|uniref:MmpS family transport accessory protein n=1 Tax=Mycobacterium lacus TaxID=169765 RepID=UPI001E46E8EE|nr:MmpS family transport accessory protein [Mycobacterium lacus]